MRDTLDLMPSRTAKRLAAARAAIAAAQRKEAATLEAEQTAAQELDDEVLEAEWQEHVTGAKALISDPERLTSTLVGISLEAATRAHSPHVAADFVGDAHNFLLKSGHSPELRGTLRNLSAAVRAGTTTLPSGKAVSSSVAWIGPLAIANRQDPASPSPDIVEQAEYVASAVTPHIPFVPGEYSVRFGSKKSDHGSLA